LQRCIKLMNAIKEISTFSISNAISHCMGNSLSEKYPRKGREAIFKDETSGDSEVLSGLGD